MHKKRNVFRTKSQCFHANYVYVIAFFTQARNMPNGKARSTWTKLTEVFNEFDKPSLKDKWPW